MQSSLDLEHQRGPLAHLPPEVQGRIGAGVRSLCALEDAEKERIVRTSISLIDRYRPMSTQPHKVAELLGSSDISDANMFFAVMTLVTYARPGVDHQATIEYLHAKDMLEDSNRESATALLSVLETHYAEGRVNVQKMSLEAEVLPYLMDFEATVDVRLGYGPTGNNVEFAVPVAMLHVDTDSYNQEIWFQAGITQIETMIERLQVVAERMKAADSLAKKLNDPS